MDDQNSELPNEALLTGSGMSLVAEADSLAARCQSLLDGPAKLINIDLTGVVEADITLFQIILAFNSALLSRNRHMILAPLPIEHPVSKLANLLGIPLERHLTIAGML